MNKQKGQSMVEFAFIVPFLVFLFLALVYGGILFMDYIQYNNAARAIARAAAFSPKDEFNDSDKEVFKQEFNPLTTLYTAEIAEVKKNTTDSENPTVTVKINLIRAVDLNLLGIISNSEVEFPPKYLKPIVYTMPVEKKE